MDPLGNVWDVTDRLLSDGLGEITESTEEDFLQLAHGDADLTFDNADGAFDRYFRGVAPGDIYELWLDRKAGARARTRWQRIFAGTLDLPWSLHFNRGDRTCAIQAFSFSKLLEKVSAESVRRAVTGLTGSVTATSKVVTVSSTANLAADDKIRLRDNTNDETQTIAKVLTGTTIQTLAAWEHTFPADTPLTVETPYWRDRSIESLAGELFALAKIPARTIDILSPLASYVIATPMNTTSYPRDANTGLIIDPRCLTQRGLKLDMRLNDGGINSRAETTDPAAAWSVATTGSVLAISDWTPYLDLEPANFPTNASFNFDDGTSWVTNHVANILWEFRFNGTNYDLFKNGSLEVANVFTGLTGNPHSGAEVDPVSGDVWMSVTGTIASGVDGVKVWNGAAMTTIETGFSGQVRYLRRLKLMAIHEYDPGAGSSAILPTTTMRLYDAATRALVRTVTVPQNLWAWSLRIWQEQGGLRVGSLYLLLGRTRMAIWDSDWKIIIDYEVAGAASGIAGTRAFLSVFTDPYGKEFPCGSAGNSMFVLAKGYRGVIPYADMGGKSVAAALREIAIMADTYLDVDIYKTGRIVNRSNDDAIGKLNAVALDVPLSRDSLPLWEFYRTSAEISGTSGVKEIVGDTGDSARRISLSSGFIATGSLAQTVGLQFVSLLSQKLRQEEISIVEPARLLHVFDRVRLGGRIYLIVELTLQPMDRIYDLRLVEAPM